MLYFSAQIKPLKEFIVNRACYDTFTLEIFKSGVTQRTNLTKDMKLDHAKKNGIYYVNTYISHLYRNLI